jgi:hypothetical protein
MEESMELSRPALLGALLLGACNPETRAEGICDDLCRELVQGCDYAAFPSLDSCRQGCAWNKEEGADIQAEYDCVTEASCDTFAIVECEHAYGIE